MKTFVRNYKRREEGAIFAYFIVLVIASVAIASVGVYVSQTSKLSQRRGDMVAANQYAVAGAVIACDDLNRAVTNGSSATLGNKLMSSSTPYMLVSGMSTSAQKVYQRIISSPFTDQNVTAQIWLPNMGSPTTAKIVTTASVRGVAQRATVNVKMAWAYPAAILSVNAGTTETSIAKSVAQDGNVVVNGDKSGPIVVDGGPGLAVMANGRVDMDTNYVQAPSSAY